MEGSQEEREGEICRVAGINEWSNGRKEEYK